MDFDSFYAAYKPHEDKPMAVHFRIKTHGNLDQENTHPFQVGRNLAFIHNGVIQAVDRPDKTKSDTYWFNQKILVPVYKRDSRFIFKDHFKELIKEYIGWSKLVFLNNKGHYTIINEDKGNWDEGVWYSNSSYKQPRQSSKKIVPFTEQAAPNQQEVFAVGSRVEIKYDYNKQNNGFGVVEYFTGGGMIGVKMDGQEAPKLIHMSFIHLAPKTNPFKIDDWVVRKDGNGDEIGEVQGIVGDSCMIKWIEPTGLFGGALHVVSASKLEYWWDTSEGYMQ
jgi:hypothetical protein